MFVYCRIDCDQVMLCRMVLASEDALSIKGKVSDHPGTRFYENLKCLPTMKHRGGMFCDFVPKNKVPMKRRLCLP